MYVLCILKLYLAKKLLKAEKFLSVKIATYNELYCFNSNQNTKKLNKNSIDLQILNCELYRKRKNVL